MWLIELEVLAVVLTNAGTKAALEDGTIELLSSMLLLILLLVSLNNIMSNLIGAYR